MTTVLWYWLSLIHKTRLILLWHQWCKTLVYNVEFRDLKYFFRLILINFLLRHESALKIVHWKVRFDIPSLRLTLCNLVRMWSSFILSLGLSHLLASKSLNQTGVQVVKSFYFFLHNGTLPNLFINTFLSFFLFPKHFDII